MVKDRIKKLGQFFTVNPILQDFVFHSVRNPDCKILEPSFGAGHLIEKFLKVDSGRPMTLCELDETIAPIVHLTEHQKIIYGDFLAIPFEEKFRTIVGNPPYVKKNPKNLYLQFIEKCFRLLDERDGEMIMIVPSDFLKSTHGSKIIQTMLQRGSFTDFLIQDTENLFPGANVHVVVFRFQMGVFSPQVRLNGEIAEYSSENGIITFTGNQGDRIGSLFDVYVGMVSGKDEVYRHREGNLEILVDQDRTERFIYMDVIDETSPSYRHLYEHKNELISRRIRKFNESNWFQWGAPRNKRMIETHKGRSCIYVHTITRNSIIAFAGTVQYFGGSLLCTIPKKPLEISNYLAYLNSDEFKKEYNYAGRFKIGQRQLLNAVLK
jgi:adenine-specific DNA-methyltransferase